MEYSLSNCLWTYLYSAFSLGLFTAEAVEAVKLSAFPIRSLCINWDLLETNYQFFGDIV